MILANLIAAAAAVATGRLDINITGPVWDVMASCTQAGYKACPRAPECDYQPAMCAYNGDPAVECKVRRKGSSTWRAMHDRPSLKIKGMEDASGNKYHFGTWPCTGACAALPGSELAGETANQWNASKLVLNNMVLGSGDVQTYAMFRRAGAIAPLAVHTVVTMQRAGVTVASARYAMIESFNDKTFMKKYIH